VFTNFWQANYFLQKEITTIPFMIYSIALKNPSNDKIPYIYENIPRLDFFCPTWEILQKYKQDNDWQSYTDAFMILMRERRSGVVAWLNNLEQGYSYYLCCWENTAEGANCHRKLLYDALKKNNKYSDAINLIYLHGNEKNYES
jgi:hypothetical protein